LLTSARRAKLLQIRKTPRSQALVPQGPRKGREEHTHRHTVKAYTQTHRHTVKAKVEENQTGSRLTYAEGVEGDSGEKEWWEGNRRERENPENRVEGGRREDDMRERDTARRKGEELGRGQSGGEEGS